MLNSLLKFECSDSATMKKAEWLQKLNKIVEHNDLLLVVPALEKIDDHIYDQANSSHIVFTYFARYIT